MNLVSTTTTKRRGKLKAPPLLLIQPKQKSYLFLNVFLLFTVGFLLGNRPYIHHTIHSTASNIHNQWFGKGVTDNNISDSENVDTTNKEGVQSPPLTAPSSQSYQSAMSLVGALQKERVKIEKALFEEYGEWYPTIFLDRTLLRELFPFPEQILFFLRRRMIIKILQSFLLNKSNSKGGNDISTKITFSWVTVGDEAAAGYGNLPWQSYTSIIESTVQGAFQSVGLQFHAQNHAQSNESIDSSSAISSTTTTTSERKEVQYPNVDILNYDFVSLEVYKSYQKMLSLKQQATTMFPSMPILMAMDYYNNNNDKRRQNDLEKTKEKYNPFHNDETIGRMKNDVYHSTICSRRIPDSTLFTTQQEQLPLGLAYFRCHQSIEATSFDICPRDITFTTTTSNTIWKGHNCDTNICSRFKFNTKEVCGNDVPTSYQDYRFPGWKNHLLKGRLMGIFLIDTLQDALFQLDSMA